MLWIFDGVNPIGWILDSTWLDSGSSGFFLFLFLFFILFIFNMGFCSGGILVGSRQWWRDGHGGGVVVVIGQWRRGDRG